MQRGDALAREHHRHDGDEQRADAEEERQRQADRQPDDEPREHDQADHAGGEAGQHAAAACGVRLLPQRLIEQHRLERFAVHRQEGHQRDAPPAVWCRVRSGSLMKALHFCALDLLCSQKPTYSSTAEDSRAVTPSVTSRWAPLMLMIRLDTAQVTRAEQQCGDPAAVQPDQAIAAAGLDQKGGHRRDHQQRFQAFAQDDHRRAHPVGGGRDSVRAREGPGFVEERDRCAIAALDLRGGAGL